MRPPDARGLFSPAAPDSPARPLDFLISKVKLPSAAECAEAARCLRVVGGAGTAAFVEEALGLDESALNKPTSFLYRGPVAQLATSTAGMYGEMVESFTRQARDARCGAGMQGRLSPLKASQTLRSFAFDCLLRVSGSAGC